MSTEDGTVLVAIANADRRDRAAEALADEGFDVVTATSVEEGRERVDEQYVEAVVAGDDLADGDGFDLLEYVRETRPDAVCVLYTNTPADEIDTAAHPALVVDYVDAAQPDATAALVADVVTAVQRQSHTSYPLPADEGERLVILDTYLGVEYEARTAFDRLARVARLSLDTAVAFVGLVDRHTEHVVACRGADWSSIEREDSVCTYGILSEEATVVEDLRGDPRFREHDYVTERGLRSYVGVPLVTPDGYRVGMFCVLDDETRSFDADEVEILELLAAETMEQLELRRLLSESTR